MNKKSRVGGGECVVVISKRTKGKSASERGRSKGFRGCSLIGVVIGVITDWRYSVNIRPPVVGNIFWASD